MEITTDRLLLRPYRVDDIGAAYGVLGDPETMSFYPRPYTLEEVKHIVEKNIRTYKEQGYGMFGVIEQTSGAFIGDCGITLQVIDGAEELEIGYRIGKAYWGRGYAAEAARAIRDYGFQQLGLKKLCSYMASDHRQSRRVAEKLGMQVVKEYRNPRNRDLPTTVYSISIPAGPAVCGEAIE